MSRDIKFLSDGMLGKLTRWLRILGYDVKYVRDETDVKLMETAEKEGRVLLTSDIQLYRKTLRIGCRALLVDRSQEAVTLAKMAEEYGLSLSFDGENSRCPVCNSPIRTVKPEELQERIPSKVLKTYREFWICINPACEKFYWQGGHWRKINETLDEARRMKNYISTHT